MASCDFCGTSILFGGVKQRNLRFCNAKCAGSADMVQASLKIPEAEIERAVREVHQGDCPKCGGRGPVDLHTSHRVYSALAWTSWSSHPAICCRSCGIKNQLKHSVFSMLLGWWGFPFGLLITPVQIGRNLAGIIGLGAPDPDTPSPALGQTIRLTLAARQ